MKNIEIKITKSTRYVDFENDNEKVGNIGENLQSMLIFSFTDEFVNGQARLDYTINGESQYVFMEKVGETYQTPVTSQLAQNGSIDLQLVITEGTDENEIPKFKSNVFYLPFGKSINAEIEQPEEYEEWIDVANTKLNQVDNVDIDITTIDEVTKVEITRKDGTKKEATVNGSVNAITDVLVDGKTVVINNVANIDLSNKVDKVEGKELSTNDFTNEDKEKLEDLSNYDDSEIKKQIENKQDKLISGQNIKTINNQSILGEGNIIIESSEGGTSNYEGLENKPKINNIELNGNKTLEQLGIQPKGNYLTSYTESDPTVPSHVKNIKETDITNWNNKSNFSGNYNDLSNKPTIPTVPTKISAFENDEGYLKEHQDLSGYAKKTDIPNVSNFITKDVTDLTNYYNKTEIDTMIGDIESLLSEV